MEAAIAYLERVQEPDGAWCPLWFGNQEVPDEINRTYGTAMILIALNQIASWTGGITESMRAGAAEWLLAAQNSDGGWGAGHGSSSSIEESALAIEALAGLEPREAFAPYLERGAEFLIERTRAGTVFPARPMGFYFATLWYSERLYPMVWTVSALQSLCTKSG
jgi:squalene-hopene/tetraprenyl-beta-curcumene cyclase